MRDDLIGVVGDNARIAKLDEILDVPFDTDVAAQEERDQRDVRLTHRTPT